MAHFDSRYIATKVIMMLSESLRDLKLDIGENTKKEELLEDNMYALLARQNLIFR